MAFAKIKKQFLTRKVEQLQSEKQQIDTLNFKKIHSVAIITTNQLSSVIDLTAEVKKAINSVRTVQIYSFRGFRKSNKVSYKHFSENDFSFRGKIKDPSFENFLAKEFDLLIGYFETSQMYLNYASLLSNATFKVGFSGVNNQVFDLVISENAENYKSFFAELKKYTSILIKL